MSLDVEIGKQKGNFIIRYTPEGTPVRAPRPVVLSNLDDDRFYSVLRGLKDQYGTVNLVSLTNSQGVSEELTYQALEEIRSRI